MLDTCNTSLPGRIPRLERFGEAQLVAEQMFQKGVDFRHLPRHQKELLVIVYFKL